MPKNLALLMLAIAGASATSNMTSMVTGMEDPGSLREAFSNSFVMILVTELGDKTFFIAALLAMRNDRLAVWAGAAGALAAMTALSACIGLVLPSLLPRKYTHWAAVALFVYFGAKLLFEAVQMLRSGTGKGPSDELEEVEQELKDGSSKEKKSSAVALQALTLTFLAEWGDRSQIATIALAAAKDPLGVTLGGIIGHSCCTSLAVLGGRVLATRISERAVVSAGGVLFLLFALHGAVVGSSD
mmetsp:Transcript_71790/g.126755  ORF Transcript_71790/g.126755 Transcript_71790/m.126755 type:complete len:243 (+) Transcript_71790:90-818(+)